MDVLAQAAMQAATLFYLAFAFGAGILVLAVAVMFAMDRTQRADAILYNYPVLGHMRYVLSHLGEFFRQYFFAMDREELPFNRAERNWVERAARNGERTVAFGSTRSIKEVGTPLFVNCPYPTLDKDQEATPALIVGPYSDYPYEARSIFNISGMSFGALSAPAVLALSKGASLAGCWMNTGEGGLAPQHLEGGADIVFQIGTAKYGVRNADGTLSEERLRALAAHPQVRMFELKLSQGAKPGKGGILPAAKVTPEIAAIRGIEPGKDSISPNRHPEIDNNEQLLGTIARIKRITGKPVGFKAVMGAYGWLDDLCVRINARDTALAPDFLTLDSGDGGTGAAPLALMDNVGLSIKESLPLVRDILLRHGLGDRIPVIAAGKLVTPAEVAWALCAGASFVNSARGFMFALGCIQSLKCNQNTCPTGITTHSPRLQKGLNPADKAVRVANYCLNMVHDVEVIAHSCGVPHPRRLRRFHVRIMGGDGKSRPLNELYPSVDPGDAGAAAARAQAAAKAAATNDATHPGMRLGGAP